MRRASWSFSTRHDIECEGCKEMRAAMEMETRCRTAKQEERRRIMMMT
jgi:hypothetical protein